MAPDPLEEAGEIQGGPDWRCLSSSCSLCWLLWLLPSLPRWLLSRRPLSALWDLAEPQRLRVDGKLLTQSTSTLVLGVFITHRGERAPRGRASSLACRKTSVMERNGVVMISLGAAPLPTLEPAGGLSEKCWSWCDSLVGLYALGLPILWAIRAGPCREVPFELYLVVTPFSPWTK